MKKIFLLTGATGFVGYQILKDLSNRGVYSKVIVRKGKSIFFKENNALLIEEIIETEDLFKEDVDWWVNNFKNVDTVIHSAWYVEPGKYINSNINYDCMIGTINMAKGAILSKVNKFLSLGSCFEYNLKYGILDTQTPLSPENSYTLSKISTYLILKDIFLKSTIKFIWCRLFYLYGEGEHPNRLVPYLLNQIKLNKQVNLTKGLQIRDYLDVKVAASNIVDKIFLIEEKNNTEYNICSGIPISIKDFVISIAEKYNALNLLNFGSREENVIDPAVIVGIK